MNQLTSHLKPRKQQIWTINQCLLALGASRDKVYSKYFRNSYGKPAPYRSGVNDKIYSRYTRDELKWMADDLYKQAVQRYHPDRHNNEQFYHDKMAEINQAYQRIKKILK